MFAAVLAKLNGKLNLVDPDEGLEAVVGAHMEKFRAGIEEDCGKMTVSRALSMAMVLGMAVQAQPARAEVRLPQSGSYEITARLELPHLERWAVDKTTIICLPLP